MADPFARFSSPAPSPAPDPFASGPATDPFAAAPAELSSWRRYGAMALRGLGSLIGAGVGSIAAPGVGTLAGGAVGGGLGEWGAQMLEGRDFSPWEVGTQTAIGAIPIKGGGLLKTMGKSAGMGAAGNVAYTHGTNPDATLDDYTQAAVTGGVVAGGAGGLMHKVLGAVGRPGSPSLRAILRQEAIDAPPTLPRYSPHTGDVADMAGAGGPGVMTPSIGPLSRHEQVMGIDPSRIRPAAPPTGAWWAPNVRSTSPVRDVPGVGGTDSTLGGRFRFSDGPGGLPRQPAVRAGNTVVDMAGEGTAIDPFRVAAAEPAGLPGPLVRAGASGQAATPPMTLAPGATPEPFELPPLLKPAMGAKPPAPVPTLPAGAPTAAMTPVTQAIEAIAAPGGAGAVAPVAAAPVRTAADVARESGKPFVPSEVFSTWLGLRPKWADTLASTGSDMREDLPFFARRVLSAENPRKLMGAERKAVAAAKAAGKPIVPGAPELQPGATTPHPVPRPDTIETTSPFPGGPPAPAPPPPPAAAAATGKLRVRKDPDFAMNGIHHVTLEDGTQARVFYDRASQTWYEDLPTTQKHTSHYSDLTGNSRDELIAKIRQRGTGTDAAKGAPKSAAIDPETSSLDDMVTRLYGDETGSIDPEVARRLGLHAGSAAIGGGVAGAMSDDETRTRNMIGGAVLGAAAPTAFTKGGAELLGKLRYFSMLGSTGAQSKNIVGNAGSVLVRASEEALTGNTQTAKDLLSQVFSRETAARIVDAFKNAPAADTRWGKNTGALGVFSRIMHAVDEGVTAGLERGGLTNAEAKTSLFTSEPLSKSGKWIASRPEYMSAVVPFVRTGVNIVERGLEHTPGIGSLPAVRAMRGSSTDRVIARQALGALAMAAGVGLGESSPTVGAAMGPLWLPYTIGARGREAYERRSGDPFSNVARSVPETIGESLPLPSSSTVSPYDPARFLASFVPGLLRDASAVPPSEFKQPGLFDPAIAKIPFLNEALLERKPPKRAARAASSR